MTAAGAAKFPTDPARLALEDFRENFGNDELFIILLHPPDVFDSGFLTRLERVHQKLEEAVPYLADINSLVNARLTRGEEDKLIVGELLERVPDTPEAMAAFRTTVLTNPLYRNSLVSGDGRYTAIGIEPDLYHLADPLSEEEPRKLETAEYAQMLEQIEAILGGMKVDLVGEGLRVRYVPTGDDLAECRLRGKELAGKLQEIAGTAG